MAANRGMAGTIIRLFVLSLVVGLVLSLFDITPRNLLRRIGGTAEEILGIGVSAVEWAVPFVLIGAVVVVPIWVISKLIRVARGR